MSHDILIVDDELDIRSLLSGILQDEGYDTRQAANSTQAIAAINLRLPTLIILDIWLQNSELDGLKILEWIQKSDQEKIKWIQLGKTMYNRGKDEIIGFNNEEYQTNLKNCKKRFEAKIETLNNKINTERNLREFLTKKI